MRERILRETARIVASDGYAALSMRRLAEGLGLTAGALYRYFPTKQHVLNASWSAALDELNLRFTEADRPGREPIPVLRDICLAYARFALADRDRFRLMFLENDLGNMDEFGQRSETFANYRQVVALVQAALDAGAITAPSAVAATHVLWGSVHGVLTLMIAVKELDFGDAEQLCAFAFETALRGLGGTSLSDAVPEAG
ncbi:TetR/AcrR family transcriptional regulator [Segnochrobactrum spirostomi]|nr:TetR/AcrR family transcriptional regulator [Segnochrobactrum spirostomi]